MVWQAAQSELYSAVERNNKIVLNPKNAAVVIKEAPKASENNLPVQNKPLSAQKSPNAPQSDFAMPHAEVTADNERSFPKSAAAQTPANTNGTKPSQSASNPLSALLSDRDALIIAALILLLWHEKADIKLIAALAFVLFA